MKTTFRVTLLFAAMICAATSGRADTVTVDENGNGFFTPTGGPPIPLLVLVPGPLPPFLTYLLPFPVATPGTVVITPGPGDLPCPRRNGACDIINFQANLLTFWSFTDDGQDSLADVQVPPPPPGVIGPVASISETGAEGNNGALYLAANPAQPGFFPATDGNGITYKFISDGSAVPEPASLILLGTGLLGAVLRRKPS